MSTGFRQDMPPKGGYQGIQWQRIPLKKPWSGVKTIAAYALLTAGSYYFYIQCGRQQKLLRRENEEIYVALEPLLVAERDRMFLNQLRKNREQEKDLMKNVPGWKVGTYFGDPVYKTVGDTIIGPDSDEYYAHSHPREQFNMHTYELWM